VKGEVMTIESKPRTTLAKGLAAIPRGVWALGFVSLCMDVSSEMIHSLLPLFIVAGLGVSATALGVWEGGAEAAVLVTKMGSGVLSDWLGKHKLLTLLGWSPRRRNPCFRWPTPLASWSRRGCWIAWARGSAVHHVMHLSLTSCRIICVGPVMACGRVSTRSAP